MKNNNNHITINKTNFISCTTIRYEQNEQRDFYKNIVYYFISIVTCSMQHVFQESQTACVCIEYIFSVYISLFCVHSRLFWLLNAHCSLINYCMGAIEAYGMNCRQMLIYICISTVWHHNKLKIKMEHQKSWLIWDFSAFYTVQCQCQMCICKPFTPKCAFQSNENRMKINWKSCFSVKREEEHKWREKQSRNNDEMK